SPFFGANVAVGGKCLAVTASQADQGQNALYVLDVDSGKPLWSTTLPGAVFQSVVAARANRLAVSSSYGCPSSPSGRPCVTIFDLCGGRRLLEIPAPEGAAVFGISLSLDRTLFVGAPVEGAGAVYEYDPRSGQLLQTYHRSDPPPSEFSFFGRHVLGMDRWVA